MKSGHDNALDGSTDEEEDEGEAADADVAVDAEVVGEEVGAEVAEEELGVLMIALDGAGRALEVAVVVCEEVAVEESAVVNEVAEPSMGA